MKTGVIILARANYGRWPDKVLYKLQGKTILEHVITKAQQLNVDHVIVSTTCNIEDQPIREIIVKTNCDYCLGDPEDRCIRHYEAIQRYNLDYFLSQSPAAPFFDVDYTNRLISAFRIHPGYDYYNTGGYNRSYIPLVISNSVVEKRIAQKDRDNELFVDPHGNRKTFTLYNWADKEIRNRYLFDGNIAYKIQAENHRKICEYLGHFPKDYDEIVTALLEME